MAQGTRQVHFGMPLHGKRKPDPLCCVGKIEACYKTYIQVPPGVLGYTVMEEKPSSATVRRNPRSKELLLRLLRLAHNHSKSRKLLLSLIGLPKDLLLEILDRLPKFEIVTATTINGRLRLYSTDLIYETTTLKLDCSSIVIPRGSLIRFCNNLVCIGILSMVYNVRTKQVYHIPGTFDLFGFGYDPVGKEYKLLSKDDGHSYKINTLGSKSWRRISSKPRVTPTWSIMNNLTHSYSVSFCMNGVFYWYIDAEEIVFFSLAKETFEHVDGPKRIKRDNVTRNTIHLFELDGCLCMADHQYSVRNQSEPPITDLWMQKYVNSESVWNRMATIALPLTLGNPEITYYTPTREILIAKKSNPLKKIIHLYNPRTQQFRQLGRYDHQQGFLVPNVGIDFFSF